MMTTLGGAAGAVVASKSAIKKSGVAVFGFMTGLRQMRISAHEEALHC